MTRTKPENREQIILKEEPGGKKTRVEVMETVQKDTEGNCNPSKEDGEKTGKW